MEEDFLLILMLLAVCSVFITCHGSVTAQKITDFSKCKVISDTGLNVVYACQDGITYVVKKQQEIKDGN